jgi:IS30 family transposase
MSLRVYHRYSEAQKAEMWDRWQKGESLNDIARLFGRWHSSIAGILSASGGIRPAVRKRSPRALTHSEREDISRGLMAGLSLRAIARHLHRSPSTISREIQRNGGEVNYRANAGMQRPGRGHGGPNTVN